MELPSAEQLELDLQQELHALRKDPNVYATYLRSNRQNLYKGNEIELLKDDLKTRLIFISSRSFSSVRAIPSACSSDSITHGPAMNSGGSSPPKRREGVISMTRVVLIVGIGW